MKDKVCFAVRHILDSSTDLGTVVEYCFGEEINIPFAMILIAINIFYRIISSIWIWYLHIYFLIQIRVSARISSVVTISLFLLFSTQNVVFF